MKCVEVQNLLPAEILGDLDSDPSLRREVQDHLLGCPSCAAERIEFARTIGLLRQHRQIVAKACERLDNPQPHDNPGYVGPARDGAQPRVLPARRQIRRTHFYAAAASVLIAASVWLAAARVASEGPSRPPLFARIAQPRVEIVAGGKRTLVPQGAEIATATGERKTVLIDGLHEMVLNANTSLRVETVEKEGASGPLIRLAFGEILTYVEHTGRPFVVSTPLGAAVITGTTFAVRAHDHTMNLIVAEGSVRLENPKGQVQVAAGFTSAIGADDAPSAPQACDVHQALAWAWDHPPVVPVEGVDPVVWGDLTDLWLTASAGPVRLEVIDYQEWTAGQKPWFAREFPWAFQLRHAAARSGRQVEFPQLLVASDDIRQFVFPNTPAGPVVRFRPKVWQALADRYAVGGDWSSPGHPAGAAAESTPKTPPLAEALPTWAAHFRQAEHAPQGPIPDILMRSLRAGTYLANTRTLLWLYLRHEQTGLETAARSDLLDLLQEQVRLAEGLTGQFIRLLAHGQDMPCEERARRYRRIADDLNELRTIEERVSHYETLE